MKTLLLLGLVTLCGLCHAQDFNVSATLDKILENYDKRFRPDWEGPPLQIGVTMYFINIFDINTKDQSIRADFYLRHTWTDKRLAFDAPPGIHSISLGSEEAKRFWQPDTFFPEGYAKFSQDGNVLFRFDPSGSVLKSVRVFAKARMNMDLEYFPLDKQKFSLSFESYGYTAKDIVYNWRYGKESVGISPESGSHELSIDGFKHSTVMIHLTTGNYSRLQVDVQMTRQHGYYCRHFYLPAIIAFLFAWASFWFTPSIPVVRILLILSSIMIGNYLLAQTVDFLPQVHTATMLEKYIVFGLIMSILAVAECALVVYLERRARQPTVYKTDLETNLLEGDIKKPQETQDVYVGESKKNTASYITRSTRYLMTIHQHRRSHQKVDILFISVYPIIYIIYNIWYWMEFP